jgi:photosystem II stability/assembly factor-like uncharacterized protein
MSRNLTILVLTALFPAVSTAPAQQWIEQVPQKAAGELTFNDYRQAFQEYYRLHPINLGRDKLRPTFRFEGAQEAGDRVAVEQYKMFGRWEWLTEPRTYPTGRWDFAKIDSARRRLEPDDSVLLINQADINPLHLRFERERIVWPFLKLWRPLGPSDAIGGTNVGRVNAIQFDPTNSKIIYISAPDGGVWKSTDAGATWTPKFDVQPTLSAGDIAIDPRNPTTIYVATSDPFGYGIPFWGGTYSVGVRKSTDGGNTWAATGLSWTVGQNRTIRRLVIDPTDSNILLAATSDGLYRTSDAGATWTRILSASAFDAEFQANNGLIAYATTTQVYKSTDAGATFTALTATCSGTRYSIEVARSNPDVLYTLCTNGTVQKSTDAGSTWTTVTAPGATLYGYYDNVLTVSPRSEETLYVAGFNIRRSLDGGSTWSTVPVAGHVDNHCIIFFPRSGSSLLVGNDGGLFKTINSGATWTSINKGLSITQFYSLGISRTNPTIMVLGAQDNGNMKYAAGLFTNITNADGMKGFIDWSNASNIYASIQYGGLYRSLNGGTSFTSISTPSGGAWVTPWGQDPGVANTIYAATDKVYKSVDQGTTWTAISGPLAGVGVFTVLHVAPNNARYIYAGSGTKLYRTKNGGSTWTDITAGLPVAGNFLTDLAIHDYDPNIVYVTFSGYVAGQKVYKTCDGGLSWTNISGSLPNMPANTIVHERKYNNPLYVGTDAGVYYTNDDLTGWIPYKYGLPNVIVDQLEIHYRTKVIRAATYGRGVWQAPLN